VGSGRRLTGNLSLEKLLAISKNHHHIPGPLNLMAAGQWSPANTILIVSFVASSEVVLGSFHTIIRFETQSIRGKPSPFRKFPIRPTKRKKLATKSIKYVLPAEGGDTSKRVFFFGTRLSTTFTTF